MKQNFILGANATLSFNQYVITPTQLFTHEAFKKTSSDAKILFQELLRIHSYAASIGQTDHEGRVYIDYSSSKVSSLLGCKSTKAKKVLKELLDIANTGIGLITRVSTDKKTDNNFIYYINDFNYVLKSICKKLSIPFNESKKTVKVPNASSRNKTSAPTPLDDKYEENNKEFFNDYISPEDFDITKEGIDNILSYVDKMNEEGLIDICKAAFVKEQLIGVINRLKSGKLFNINGCKKEPAFIVDKLLKYNYENFIYMIDIFLNNKSANHVAYLATLIFTSYDPHGVKRLLKENVKEKQKGGGFLTFTQDDMTEKMIEMEKILLREVNDCATPTHNDNLAPTDKSSSSEKSNKANNEVTNNLTNCKPVNKLNFSSATTMNSNNNYSSNTIIPTTSQKTSELCAKLDNCIKNLCNALPAI